MAIFDRDEQKIVVRIVYDGPANAGKTTNLSQLCRFFTTRRRSELVSYEERAGRTLFFDWLLLEGGLVGGFPLRCQLVTVPGQAVLSHRRRLLLTKADAVVFVCDSSPGSLDIARRMIDGVLKGNGGAPPPLVVQANKQDIAGALEAEAVGRALGLPEEVTVIAARAQDGIGVRETAVLAIRAAANRAQADVLAHGVEALAGRTETSEELLRLLRAEEVAAIHSGSQAGLVLASLGHGSTAETAPAKEKGSATNRARGGDGGGSAPPFPDAETPTGMVWPAAGGRAILRNLDHQAFVQRGDLAGQHGTSDGSGTSDVLIYQSGAWCLKTSPRRCFDNAESARGAMLQLARRKTQLGALLVPRTVICVQPDPEGRHWLWTVCPWLTTLRAWMTGAEAESDEFSLGVALDAFADAAVDALALALRSGLVLDVHPSNFALVDGRVTYVDDDITTAERVPAIGHALLRRIDEYAHRPEAVATYLQAVSDALPARFGASDAARLGLRQALADTLVLTEAGRQARELLLAVVERLGEQRGA
jgi:signal recognition particle receptor subunit beta